MFFWHRKFRFPRNCRIEKGNPQPSCFSNLGSLLMNSASCYEKNVIKTAGSSAVQTDTRPRRRQHIHAPQPHFLQTTQCLQAVCMRSGPLRRAAPGMSIKNIALDNAPSHACRLACDHHSIVLHGTVEFQPPYSPDLSSLDFSSQNELKTQLCLVSNSTENCGHFLAACITERGQTAVGCSRKWARLGSASWRLALPPMGFFE